MCTRMSTVLTNRHGEPNLNRLRAVRSVATRCLIVSLRVISTVRAVDASISSMGPGISPTTGSRESSCCPLKWLSVVGMMTPELMEQEKRKLGALVRAARTRMAKMSVDELALKVGCEATEVTSLERGDATSDFETILGICRELNISEDMAVIYDPGVVF